jgi:DNA-binding MarR family transcriptional regulator
MPNSATSAGAVLALERVVVASVAVTARALNEAAPELTLGQWRVLVLIDRPEGLSVGAIAATLGSKIAAVSRLLGRLRSRGLVETRRDESDARVVLVSLTTSGRDLRSDVVEQRRAELAGALTSAQLPDDADELIARLATVLEAVS